MATPKNTNVHLEAVETAENKGDEPDKTRYAQMESLPKRQYPKRVLGCCWEWNTPPHHNKWKTCTQGILWYIRSVQVYALNMTEPPCTERYARWCERSATQIMGSLLLDYFNEGLEVGAVVNDSPVDCQSREWPKPRSRGKSRIPDGSPEKTPSRMTWSFSVIFALRRVIFDFVKWYCYAAIFG